MNEANQSPIPLCQQFTPQTCIKFQTTGDWQKKLLPWPPTLMFDAQIPCISHFGQQMAKMNPDYFTQYLYKGLQ